MSFSHWLRSLATRLSRVPTPRTRRGRTFRPRVEILEDRTAPAVFTVTNTDDNGGVNPAAFAGTGTLRQAIIDANATPGADTIQFAIPDSMKTAGHTWWTIAPTSELPHITDTVLIDGWSQGGTGYRGSPEIMLDGTNAGSVNGITVGDYNYPAVADGVVIRGLAVGDFYVGISAIKATNTTIQGCYVGLDPSGTTIAPSEWGVFDAGGAYGTTIGGTNPGEGNVISGNSRVNVQTAGYSVTIRGNFIGTDPSGTMAASNSQGDGIIVGNEVEDYSSSIIADNLISGNGGDGIYVGNTEHVRIFGNLIGTDVTGTKALGNGQYGIGGPGGLDEVIGGTGAGSRNVISGNGLSGIAGADGSQVIVQGNYIGTDVNGAPTLGNGTGIYAAANWLIGGTAEGAGNLIADNGLRAGGAGLVLASSNDLVEGNVIRENYGAGVYIQPWVAPCTGNTVSQNAIYGNFPGPFDWTLGTNDGAGLGIDILASLSDTGGVTLNDSLGHDGPNHFQNFPVLTGLTSTASGITVMGTLTQSVTPNISFRIEFFANHEADPSGYGEGERYIGSVDVTTDANGTASFTAPFSALLAGEEYLTATATNLATGDTSEFSKAVGLAAATLTSSATPSHFGQPITFTAAVSAVAGSDTPTGSVDFVDTTTNTDLGTVALSGGTASLTTSSLSGGTHVIEAIYGGDGTFLGTSVSFTQTVVEYNFSGFLPPLSNGLAFAVNRTIPIKLQLTDDNGNPVTSLDAVTSLQVLNGSGMDVLAGAGTTGLRYDLTANQFVYNWQTKGLPAGSYTISLTLADGTTHTKTIQLTAGGSSAGLVTDGSGGTATAGALLGGEVDLYVDNSNGDPTSDELARIQDAVNSIDAAIAPYGVNIVEVSDPTQANVTLNMNTTSGLGGLAQGVLGCTTDADQVTMIQGWNWYVGADPTQVGAGQYDFETAVVHELGHVLGLGHSSDSTSVMYATLAAGTANRTLVTADLNVPSDDSGPCALHAAPSATVNNPSNGQGMTAPGSASILSSGSPMSVADQVLANIALLLSNARNAYQSELSSVAAMWQSVDALALQRFDSLLSLEAGAMGLSKDTLTRDLLFARMS